jgi:hypothetical protein
MLSRVNSRTIRTRGLAKNVQTRTRNLRSQKQFMTTKLAKPCFKTGREATWVLEDVGREIVTEVQFYEKESKGKKKQKNASFQSDKSMEVVDCIQDGSPKAVKTVKFETQLETGPATLRVKKAYRGLKSAIKARNQKMRKIKNRDGAGTANGFYQNCTQSTSLFTSKSTKRMQKKAKLLKQDSSTTDFSRPSSVTSMFTACSTGIVSHRFGPKAEQPVPTLPDYERELTRSIENHLYISEAPRVGFSQKNTGKY